MGKYFNKHADIYGVQKRDFTYHSPKISVDDQLPLFKEYIMRKSQESPTPWAIAIIPNTLLGAGGGALIGAINKKPLVGALIGGGLFTVIGAIAKLLDDGRIAEAKQMLNSVDSDAAVKTALLKELEAYWEYREAQNRNVKKRGRLMPS